MLFQPEIKVFDNIKNESFQFITLFAYLIEQVVI